MKFTIFPNGQEPESIDFGNGQAVISNRAPRSGKTEIINVMCELLAGNKASTDSRPDRTKPWIYSTVVQGENAGKLEFQALRYEQGKGIEASSGDLPDDSLVVLGYSDGIKCGWYHAGDYLSAQRHTSDWPSLVSTLGLLASIGDQTYIQVINECLLAGGMPTVPGASCVGFDRYSAVFERDGKTLQPFGLTRSERAGVMQVCAQVMPWLLHSRRCEAMSAGTVSRCYCLIDDMAPGLNLVAVHEKMRARFPRVGFCTYANK